jgi:lipopolysaccharide export system permease protein
MLLPWRLSIYLSRIFLLVYLSALGILLALTFLRDIVELGRQVATRRDIGFELVLQLAALRMPHSIEMISPMALLAAGMYTMWRLSRHNELVAVRAAGVSVWRFLAPCLITATAIAVFIVVFVNPLGADSMAKHDALYSRYIDPDDDAFRVSSVGAWLRESDDNGLTVIHADRAATGDAGLRLVRPTAFLFNRGGDLEMRIDADRGHLGNGYWHLVNTVSKKPSGRVVHREFIDIKTDLTLDQLQEGVASPSSIPFWRLPDIIDMTERAGFSAVRFRIHWNMLLALPVLACALTIIAATFSLRLPRRGGTVKLIVAGLLAGLAIELLKYVMVTLGDSGQVPVLLAAWTPAVAALLFGTAALFHAEDG